MELIDRTYDGSVLNKGHHPSARSGSFQSTYLTGGLGQLMDGMLGDSNFRRHHGSKGVEWVGWKRRGGGIEEGGDNDLVEVTFKFDVLRQFKSVSFYCNNAISKVVRKQHHHQYHHQHHHQYHHQHHHQYHHQHHHQYHHQHHHQYHHRHQHHQHHYRHRYHLNIVIIVIIVVVIVIVIIIIIINCWLDCPSNQGVGIQERQSVLQRRWKQLLPRATCRVFQRRIRPFPIRGWGGSSKMDDHSVGGQSGSLRQSVAVLWGQVVDDKRSQIWLRFGVSVNLSHFQSVTSPINFSILVTHSIFYFNF